MTLARNKASRCSTLAKGVPSSNHDFGAGDAITLAPDVTVTARAGTHPGGVLAYRVDHGGKSVVYVTDTEHDPNHIDDRIVELAANATHAQNKNARGEPGVSCWAKQLHRALLRYQ